MLFSFFFFFFFFSVADAPTDLATVIVGNVSIKVSWTAPTSGATVTGYHVYSHEEDAQGRIVTSICMDVGANTTELNITLFLTAGHSYNITVRALSRQLPSPAVGPSTVTVGKTI